MLLEILVSSLDEDLNTGTNIYPTLNPLLFSPTGIGYSALTVAIFFCTYYIVICSWAFFFLFSSFTTKLPWGDCLGYWTDEYCNDPTLQENVTVGFFISKNGSLVPNIFGQSPAQQFWE